MYCWMCNFDTTVSVVIWKGRSEIKNPKGPTVLSPNSVHVSSTITRKEHSFCLSVDTPSDEGDQGSGGGRGVVTRSFLKGPLFHSSSS